jgi:enoyl-CoA hydratase/carnithine racemase
VKRLGQEADMAEYETIGYRVAEGVATLTLSRPDKRNALNLLTFRELEEAGARAAEDHDARAVLVRGEGPSFCAGIDVGELTQLGGAGGDDVRALATTAQRPMLTLATMDKPTIAAVHGHALGAGFQLALACDLRIAADDASFAMLEIRFGLIPDLGGTKRLSALVGPAVAKDLIWTGRRVAAGEALRLGLVNRVVSRDPLVEEAAEMARTLAAAPPRTLALAKGLVEDASNRTLEEQLAAEREAQVACVSTEDQREAVAAYLEKREPKFAGR